jgi:hypothetical protein
MADLCQLCGGFGSGSEWWVGGEGVIRRNDGAGIIFTRATAWLRKRSDEKVSRPRVVRNGCREKVLERVLVEGSSCSVVSQCFYLAFCLYNLRMRSVCTAVLQNERAHFNHLQHYFVQFISICFFYLLRVSFLHVCMLIVSVKRVISACNSLPS